MFIIFIERIIPILKCDWMSRVMSRFTPEIAHQLNSTLIRVRCLATFAVYCTNKMFIWGKSFIAT